MKGSLLRMGEEGRGEKERCGRGEDISVWSLCGERRLERKGREGTV